MPVPVPALTSAFRVIVAVCGLNRYAIIMMVNRGNRAFKQLSAACFLSRESVS